MPTNIDIVLEVAKRTGGFVTPELLRTEGLPRATVEGGTKRGWTKIKRGLWFIHDREMNFHDWINAALMVGGEGSAIGSGASLFVRGIIAREPEFVDIWIPRERALRKAENTRIRVHRDHLDRLNRKDTSGPLLSLVDSVLDYIESASSNEEAASAVINARRKSPRFEDMVRLSAFRRPRLKRRDLFEELITCDPPFDSVMEYLWIQNVERPHRIPPSTRQWTCPDGYVRDGAWVDLLTIYELDGDAYHMNHQTLKRDSEKDYKARRRGFQTLRFRYRDVAHQPCSTAADLSSSVPGLLVSSCGPTCFVQT